MRWLHTDHPARCLAFSPEGRWLASSGADYSVRRWDCRSGTEEVFCSGLGASPGSLVFSADGSRLAWTVGYSVFLWDGAFPQARSDLTLGGFMSPRGALVRSLVFTPDG